jgi:hypothetical protein
VRDPREGGDEGAGLRSLHGLGVAVDTDSAAKEPISESDVSTSAVASARAVIG